jgi:hypothetical protein
LHSLCFTFLTCLLQFYGWLCKFCIFYIKLIVNKKFIDYKIKVQMMYNKYCAKFIWCDAHWRMLKHYLYNFTKSYEKYWILYAKPVGQIYHVLIKKIESPSFCYQCITIFLHLWARTLKVEKYCNPLAAEVEFVPPITVYIKNIFKL